MNVPPLSPTKISCPAVESAPPLGLKSIRQRSLLATGSQATKNALRCGGVAVAPAAAAPAAPPSVVPVFHWPSWKSNFSLVR